MLGMYVHTHWAYNHPYAARTWSLEDWDGYLQGLAALGYDFILLWPQLDCMPGAPNASDLAYLAKIARVIDLAHDTYGMRFGITAAPNTIGNNQSPGYRFEERPYFVCERKVNPRQPDQVAEFLAGRRRQLEPLGHADAFFMIDSDPGGYIGSTNDEFVTLMKAQLDILRETNPACEMVYWMWVGWENYNAFWARATQQKPGDPDPVHEWDIKDFLATLPMLQARIPEPWSVTASIPIHLRATDQLKLGQRRLFFPYGLIEGEPTFPLTNYAPQALSERISEYAADPSRYPLGILASSQTHCLQLPHAYLFAHFARGGSLETIDLEAFAAQVIPGCGAVVSHAWQLVESEDGAAMRASAQQVRQEIGKSRATGMCHGLLFGDADRFLADLADNLEIRASLLELKAAIDAVQKPADHPDAPRVEGDCPESRRDRLVSERPVGTLPPMSEDIVKSVLRRLLACLLPYQQRVGFADAYYGPLRTGLNEQLVRLHEPALTAIVDDFHNWREPAVRNGVALRLFHALQQYVS